MATKAKKSTKRAAFNEEHVKKVAEAMKAEQPAIKAGDQTTCGAIRKIAKRFGSFRRVELETALTGKGFKLNLGTVRRQIQIGRAA